MAPHNAWSAPECGRTASPPDAQNRFTEAARAFKKSQVPFLCHKGTFSPNTANLAAPEPAHRQRFGWSSVSYQIPRPGLFRTESWNPWDIYRARYAPRCGVECAYKPASGIYCFSHSFTCHRSSMPFCFAVIGKADTLWAKSPTCNTRQSASVLVAARCEALVKHRRALF